MIDLNATHVCLFCAHKGILHEFLLKYKSGEYNLKMSKCPFCKEKIRYKIITAKLTPEQWGEWIYLNIKVYNNPHFRFYDKWQHNIFFINFELLGKNIKNNWWEGFKKYREVSNITYLKDKLNKLNYDLEIYRKKDKLITLEAYI